MNCENYNLRHIEWTAGANSPHIFTMKDFNTAMKLIPNPNFKEPLDVALYIFYGVCNLELGNNEPVIQSFSKVIEVHPDYSDAYNYQGLAYLNLGQYEKALERFTVAISIGNETTYAPLDRYYFNRGSAHTMLMKYIEAIDDFNRSIKHNIVSEDVYIARGAAYNFLGKYDDALKDFVQALRLKPDSRFAHLYCGMVYFNVGKYEESVEFFTKVEKMAPSVYVYLNRGMAFAYLQKYETAMKDFDNALKLEPMNPNIYKLRGIAYLKWGKYQEAISDFDKSIKLNPNDLQTCQGRDEAYKALNLKDYKPIVPSTKMESNPFY
ncbi:MAG: tetratricopeptide repeat protein [Treponemataceae bacterium]